MFLTVFGLVLKKGSEFRVGVLGSRISPAVMVTFVSFYNLLNAKIHIHTHSFSRLPRIQGQIL